MADVSHKITVIARLPFERPVAKVGQFWDAQRDAQLWQYILQASTLKKRLEWDVIAETLGTSVSECMVHAQTLYSRRIEDLEGTLRVTGEDVVEMKLETGNSDEGVQEEIEELGKEDAEELRELVERYEFNWDEIAKKWKDGKYPPLECRGIYLNLPSPTTLTETSLSLSGLESVLLT